MICFFKKKLLCVVNQCLVLLLLCFVWAVEFVFVLCLLLCVCFLMASRCVVLYYVCCLYVCCVVLTTLYGLSCCCRCCQCFACFFNVFGSVVFECVASCYVSIHCWFTVDHIVLFVLCCVLLCVVCVVIVVCVFVVVRFYVVFVGECCCLGPIGFVFLLGCVLCCCIVMVCLVV